MSLKAVNLSWEAFMTCTTHALSTESEEIMGLLLGNWDNEDPEHSTLVISHVCILTRDDKAPDRVEVAPEQSSRMAQMAERITEETGVMTRVVGWYHSHPHITVLPSHVDVRTQGQYQQMDSGFIGLIFSVFNNDESTKIGSIRVTAFQSRNVAEQSSSSLTNFRSKVAPVWAQKEVILNILTPDPASNTSSRLPLSEAMENLLALQDILFKEERTAYGNSVKNGKSLLQSTNSAATYQRALCHLLETLTLPLFNSLRSRLHALHRECDQLQEANDQLRSKLTPSQKGHFERQRQTISSNTPTQISLGGNNIRFRALQMAQQGTQLIIKSGGLRNKNNLEMLFKIIRKRKIGAQLDGALWILRYGSTEGYLVAVESQDKSKNLIRFLIDSSQPLIAKCPDKETYEMWIEGVGYALNANG